MKNELKRAIVNKYFISICVYGILLIILHSYESIAEYWKNTEEFMQYQSSLKVIQNPYAPIVNAFTLWIGCDSDNKYSKLFYNLLPLTAVLPYCWSYCRDVKNGQADKFIKEIGIFNYHLSKYFAVFISSGLTITIPLLLDFLIILLFVPAIYPDSVYDIYYGIFSNNFMADIFYGKPFVYVMIFLLLCFVFCGLFGCLGYSISTLIKSKAVAVIAPSAMTILVEIFKKVTMKKDAIYMEFSPLSFLCPAKSYTTNWIIIISEFVILFLITFSIPVVRLKKAGMRKELDIFENQRCTNEK